MNVLKSIFQLRRRVSGFAFAMYIGYEGLYSSRNIKLVEEASKYQIDGKYTEADKTISRITDPIFSSIFAPNILAAKRLLKADNARMSGDQGNAIAMYTAIKESVHSDSRLFYFILKFLGGDIIANSYSFPVEAARQHLWLLNLIKGTRASDWKNAALQSLRTNDEIFLDKISIQQLFNIRAALLYATLARFVCINDENFEKDFDISLRLYKHAWDYFIGSEVRGVFGFLNPFRTTSFERWTNESPPISQIDMHNKIMKWLALSSDHPDPQSYLLFVWSIICRNRWDNDRNDETAVKLMKESAEIAYNFVQDHRLKIKENSYRNCLGMYLKSLDCPDIISFSKTSKWLVELNRCRTTVFYKKEHIDCIVRVVECLFEDGEEEKAFRLLMYYDMGDTPIKYDDVLRLARELNCATNRDVIYHIGCLLFALKHHEEAIEIFSWHESKETWYPKLKEFVAKGRKKELLNDLLKIADQEHKADISSVRKTFWDKYVREEVVAAQSQSRD